MWTVVVAVVVVGFIAGSVLLTVRDRRSVEKLWEPPQDLRRAGEETKPPFDGYGPVV